MVKDFEVVDLHLILGLSRYQRRTPAGQVDEGDLAVVCVTKIGVRGVGGGALAVNGEDGVASAGLQVQLVAAYLSIAHALADHLGLKSKTADSAANSPKPPQVPICRRTK